MEESVKVAIVVSEFNWEITGKMLEEAKRFAREIGAEVSYVCHVPGSFDMPLAIKSLLEKEDVDCVATLGAIVKGETMHDEIIAHQVFRKIVDLSINYGKPVSLGISGPGMTMEQGMARIVEYAKRSVNAAVKMAKRMSLLRGLSYKGRIIEVM